MTLTVEIQGWKAVYEGGRLADVYYDDQPEAVDCFQVDEFEGFKTMHTRPVSAESLLTQLAEWVAEDGDTFFDNVVRYR